MEAVPVVSVVGWATLSSHTAAWAERVCCSCVSWRRAAVQAWMLSAPFSCTILLGNVPACTSSQAVWLESTLGGGWGPLRCCCFLLLPYATSALCPEMELDASLPEKKSNTLSRDLIDYVRYMIQNHGENYKVHSRARDSLLHLPNNSMGTANPLCPGSCFAVS